MPTAKNAKSARKEPDAELDEWARKAIGAAMEAHRHLGPGFLESVYEEALAIEIRLRGIPFERQKDLPLFYKGQQVHLGRVDFLVAGRLLVEIKAIEEIAPIHRAIVISYMRSTRQILTILINFNVTVLKDGIERIVLT